MIRRAYRIARLLGQHHDLVEQFHPETDLRKWRRQRSCVALNRFEKHLQDRPAFLLGQIVIQKILIQLVKNPH
jgi:hypothetical protein